MHVDVNRLWEGSRFDPLQGQPQGTPGVQAWLPVDRWQPPAAAHAFLPWMMEPGSLTQRLREHYPPVQVEPLFEGRQAPHPHEARILGQPDPHEAPAWVREVQLLGAQVPRLWARTVIPQWSAHNPWAQVQTLGQQPLGELLFVWPDIVRGPLHMGLTPLGWARYCVYHRHQAPLLLTELFLPTLLQP